MSSVENKPEMDKINKIIINDKVDKLPRGVLIVLFWLFFENCVNAPLIDMLKLLNFE